MPNPSYRFLVPGVPHRALESLQMLIYDYDALGVQTRLLRTGAVFRPWEPLAHWRDERMPITLGDSALQFDWGMKSPAGHFLRWDDFFERCAPLGEPHAKARPRIHEHPLASPFAELPAIGERLRRAADQLGTRAVIDKMLASIGAIHVEHTAAAESQRAAEGFDNTEVAARYAMVQARLLAQAQDILSKTKALLR